MCRRNTVVFTTSAIVASTSARRASRFVERLRELRVEATAHQVAVHQPDLAGHDHPVTGPDRSGVRQPRGVRHGQPPRRPRTVSGRSGGHPRSTQTAAATAAKTASDPFTGGPVVGLDLDLDGRRVGRPDDAERADREVVHRRRPRRPPAPRSSPSRAPCGPHRCSSCGAPPRRAGRRTRTRTEIAPVADRRPRPRAPSGEVTGPATPASPARSSATSAQPGGPEVDRGRRAGDVDLLQHELRGRGRQDRRPGRACGPPAPPPTRRGAARGDRRSLRAHAARCPRGTAAPAPARPCSSASARAAPVTGDVTLRTEGAAVGERRRRLAPGRAPRRVGLEVGGLHPGRPERDRPVAVRQRRAGARPRPSCAGPAPCRPRRGPRPASRRPTSRRGRRAPRRARPAARCRRRSRPRRGRPPARPAAGCAPRSWPAGSPPRGRGRVDGVARARPPSRPRRSSASPCSGTGGPTGPDRPPRRPAPPLARSPASRTMMPGRAEAALAGTGGAERVGPRRALLRRRGRRAW